MMNAISPIDFNRFDILDLKVNDTSDAPIGAGIFYYCKKCKTAINSRPNDNIGCKCGDIFIDVDYHRLAIKDFSQFQVIKEKGHK